MPVLNSTYSQQERVDKEASIFSIGGYCAYNLISVDSEAFCSFFFSCDTLEERQWVSSKLKRTLKILLRSGHMVHAKHDKQSVIIILYIKKKEQYITLNTPPTLYEASRI